MEQWLTTQEAAEVMGMTLASTFRLLREETKRTERGEMPRLIARQEVVNGRKRWQVRADTARAYEAKAGRKPDMPDLPLYAPLLNDYGRGVLSSCINAFTAAASGDMAQAASIAETPVKTHEIFGFVSSDNAAAIEPLIGVCRILSQLPDNATPRHPLLIKAHKAFWTWAAEYANIGNPRKGGEA